MVEMQGWVSRRRENMNLLWTTQFLKLMDGDKLVAFKRPTDPTIRKTIQLTSGTVVRGVFAEKSKTQDPYYVFKVEFPSTLLKDMDRIRSDSINSIHGAVSVSAGNSPVTLRRSKSNDPTAVVNNGRKGSGLASNTIDNDDKSIPDSGTSKSISNNCQSKSSADLSSIINDTNADDGTSTHSDEVPPGEKNATMSPFSTTPRGSKRGHSRSQSHTTQFNANVFHTKLEDKAVSSLQLERQTSLTSTSEGVNSRPTSISYRSIEFSCKTEGDAEKWKIAIEEAVTKLKLFENKARDKAKEKKIGETPASVSEFIEQYNSEKTKKHETTHIQLPYLECFSVNGPVPVYIRSDTEDTDMLSEAKYALILNNLIVKSLFSGMIALILTYIACASFITTALLVIGSMVTVGYSIFESVELKRDPVFVAHIDIMLSPSLIQQFILQTSTQLLWNQHFYSLEVVENVNDHSDIIHIKLNPIKMFGFYFAPRDLCVIRYWRREEDGSYFTIYQSTLHKNCPPLPDYVRATLHASASFVQPLKSELYSQHLDICRVTETIHYDPMGYASFFESFFRRYESALRFIQRVSPLKDIITQQNFVDINLTDATNDNPMAPQNTAIDSRGMVVGVKKLPNMMDNKYWGEPDGSLFQVRGPCYIQDKKKVNSASSLFNCVGFEVLSFEDASGRLNIMSRADNIIEMSNKENPNFPFTFGINLIIPHSLNIAVMIYYQPVNPNWKSDPAYDLFLDFIEGDDTFRNDRFKLIPTIKEGNLLIKKALGCRPAIIGNKGLTIPYYKQENSFEVCVDVNSDAHARNITGMVSNAISSLIVDIAFLVEGKTEEELPEVALGTIRMNHVDLKKAKRVPSC